jgi:hypothetical protein
VQGHSLSNFPVEAARLRGAEVSVSLPRCRHFSFTSKAATVCSAPDSFSRISASAPPPCLGVAARSLAPQTSFGVARGAALG